ncbi:MAG: hypothetical protein ACLSUW_01925 [Akkermansia sp.]
MVVQSDGLQMQADFIIARSVAALERIKGQSRRPEEMAARCYAVASVPNGMYALIDYVNFREKNQSGGTLPGDRLGAQAGAGEMRSVSPGQPAAVGLRKRPKGCFSAAWTTARRAAEKRAGLPDGGTGAIPIREFVTNFFPNRKTSCAIILDLTGIGV